MGGNFAPVRDGSDIPLINYHLNSTYFVGAYQLLSKKSMPGLMITLRLSSIPQISPNFYLLEVIHI